VPDTSPRIRPGRPEDAQQIAQVNVEAWQSAFRGLMPQDYLDHIDLAARVARWRRTLDNLSRSGEGVLVATKGTQIIGFAGFGPSHDPDENPARTGLLDAIYLAPGCWGKGAGRQLMAAALRQLASAGYAQATLWVLDSNARARRFYAAGGWTPDGASKVDASRGFPLNEIRYRRTLMTTAAAAGTWKLGDLTVNRMGFGAMRLSAAAPFGTEDIPSDRDRSIAVLRQAVELGVNHIDTAAFYFSRLRSANELINRALAPYPEDLVITTKVWAGRDPSGEWYWATPEQLRGQVEENLRQLGRDHLDVVNLRIPPRSAVSVAEHFGALAELRDKGLIRHLGISNASPHHLAEALAIAPVVCVQNRYGIGAAPADHDFLDACGSQGVAFTPFFAIAGQGRASGVAAAESSEVLAVAEAHGASPAQVRLAWTLERGPHVLAIPGTGNPSHLSDNIAAAELRLAPEEMSRLTAIQDQA